MNLFKTFAFALIGLFTFTAANASNFNTDDKVTLKAREIVAKAAPDDWKAYAQAAAKCVSRNKNMAEAIQWIDKSIAIQATAYNHDIKGDYYIKNNLPEKAMEYYIKALDLGRTELNFDASEIQEKLMKIRNTR
ncbi:MAG: hypothetical protein EAZ57_08750 [Cytophagales bacterium]|nr:MAG: hypothetical protein EAZ67_09560 [Cytophagales bacterium]TAF60114.1 MAG: hypothetical protein EAZ57_08750 [Cytophagales bacterium]